MSLPSILLNTTIHRVMSNLTNIYIHKEEHKIVVSHAGQAGDTLETIREIVDRALGVGSFDEFRNKCKKETINGTPDYMFTMTLEF